MCTGNVSYATAATVWGMQQANFVPPAPFGYAWAEFDSADVDETMELPYQVFEAGRNIIARGFEYTISRVTTSGGVFWGIVCNREQQPYLVGVHDVECGTYHDFGI